MAEPLITSRTDWDIPLLNEIYSHIEDIAVNDLKLDVYPNQIEVISAEQMIDAYASIGLPVNYSHWSFGKDFLKNWTKYQKGKMGLAYEIVINSDPCISYLMEENNAVTQTLVMAHAGFGHNAVFKNNFLFKEWTSAGSIIDYMLFAKNYISECEDKYGEDEVEMILDAAHTLSSHSVDKRKRKYKKKLSESELQMKTAKEEDDEHNTLDIIISTVSGNMNEEKLKEKMDVDLDSVDDEENLIYFIYKNAPNMPQWQREILRIVYKIRTYFYPQGQCVTGDNLVSTGDGLLRLDELIQENGFNEVTGIKLLTDGDKLTPISHTYLKRSAKVMKISTASGREYIGTPEHPLMVLDGILHNVKPLSEMSLSDHIVLNTDYSNVFSKKQVVMKQVMLNDTVKCELCGLESAYLPTHIIDTHGIQTADYSGELSSGVHSANKSVNYPTKFPQSLTSELAELLGFWDKITHPSGVASIFSWNGNPILANRIVVLLENVFGIVVKTQPANIEGNLSVTFSSWGLRQFLELNFDFKEQGILKQLRQSPQHVLVSYIRALFDKWSGHRSSIGNFEYATYDDVKLHQLQVVLGSMGIVVNLKTVEKKTVAALMDELGLADIGEHKDVYSVKTLKIPAAYHQAFENVIGSFLPLPLQGPTVNSTKGSIIPGAKQLLDEIKAFIVEKKQAHFDAIPDKMSYSVRVKNKLLWKYQDLPNALDLPEIRNPQIYFSDLNKFAGQFELAVNVPCEAAKKLKALLNISRGCHYDRVVSIEEIEEERDVYDVTVPENHLFWMSGLISHNTKILNEGFATFTHFYIMDELEKKGLISPDAQLAWLHMHSNVVYQPDIDSRHYDGTFNPYALGLSILKDVRRICENPTKEDEEWFPDLIGKEWRQEVQRAAFEYRDESFIEQFMSPKLMREMNMFSVNFSRARGNGIVEEISDDLGYRNMRRTLALQHNPVNSIPNITVKSAKMRGDRMLTLEYHPYCQRSLHRGYAEKTMQHIKRLWGYPVEIVQFDRGIQTVIAKV
jgi:spore cortex formation protein SpoVR/YcgB (stage V sporulation)